MLKKNRSITLCLICQKYCGGCAWSKWLEAVEGWTAVCDYKKNGSLNHAFVCWCPEFVADRGLYDMIVHGDANKGRSYINRQYGFLTDLRYITIRYHLVNDYERSAKDESEEERQRLQMRHFNEAFKRKVQHAVPL